MPDDQPDLKTPVLWPLVVIASASAFIITTPVLMAYAAVAAIVAALAAGVVGAPALYAARDLGLRGLWLTAVLGLGIGAGCTLVAQAIAGGPAPFRYVYVIEAGIIGAVSGAIYATLFDMDNLSGARVRYQTIGILAAGVAALLASIALGVR